MHLKKTTINIALIGPSESKNGYGIGSYILKYLNLNNCVEIKAIGGRTIESITRTVNDLGIQSRFLDFYDSDCLENIFIRDDIDLIVVATPVYTHFFFIELGVKYKKHLLIDKPLVKVRDYYFNNETLIELFNQANKSKILLSTNCQRAALVEINNIPKPNFFFSSEISIGLKKGLLNDVDIFELLISHPVSIMVKLGMNNVNHINSVVFEKVNNPEFNQFLYTIKYGHINCLIYLKQYKFDIPTFFSVEVDDLNYEAGIEKINGDVMTKVKFNNEEKYFDDFLKISIDKCVESILSNENKVLINNVDSLRIYLIESFLYKNLFN